MAELQSGMVSEPATLPFLRAGSLHFSGVVIKVEMTIDDKPSVAAPGRGGENRAFHPA